MKFIIIVVGKHLGKQTLRLFLTRDNNIELHRKEVNSEEVNRSESRSCHAHFGISDFQMLDYNTMG